eukprot:359121-Chlamydomonas_euryale.AAC.5
MQLPHVSRWTFSSKVKYVPRGQSGSQPNAATLDQSPLQERALIRTLSADCPRIVLCGQSAINISDSSIIDCPRIDPRINPQAGADRCAGQVRIGHRG